MSSIDPDTATFVPYVPAAYGKTPTTAAEVCDAAACLLEEEGRWLQSNWYFHHDPTLEEYVDNPFCNGWGVCADGALQAVTVGTYRRNTWQGWFMSGLSPAYPDSDEGRLSYGLYCDALHLAEEHLQVLSGGVYRAITSWNDEMRRTREDVVGMFRGAAALGRTRDALVVA